MSGVLGVGVDVVHLPRLAALVGRRGFERLATRILSKAEMADWKQLGSSDAHKISFLAVRYDNPCTPSDSSVVDEQQMEPQRSSLQSCVPQITTHLERVLL